MLLQMTKPVQGGLRQEKKMEIISNHLANSDTTGFKGDIISFDAIFKNIITTDHTQGDIKLTGSNLDVAIKGKGFFKIQTPNGVKYTRDGNFSLNKDGMLVTQNGHPVICDGGPITITGNNININSAGDILVDGKIINRLSVVNFDDLKSLQKEGNSIFAYDGSGQGETTAKDYSVEQGYLETPNINVVFEMTNMIDTSRKYESYQKMLQTFDETDGKAINEVGRLS